MKTRHNKKRNTAFLFEALVRELTKAVVAKNTKRSRTIKTILNEHFRRGMVLFSELDCFNTLADKSGVDKYTAEKMVFRAKKAFDDLDPQEVFREQSSLLGKINKKLGQEVYNNFVPNYQSIASLAQIFGDKMPIKSRVIMEQRVIKILMSPLEELPQLKPIDALVVKTFCERFNQSYEGLLSEQKELLSKYIISFNENSADFRLFLGKELKRIQERVEASLQIKEVLEDSEMVKNTRKVLEHVQKLNVSRLTEKDLLKVLKLQQLAREYQNDADQD
jgi:hypothetical protein